MADQLAKSAAISTEAATGLLLWLGSVCMIHHTQILWPSGIWQPAGLTLSVVEEDGVPIDSITNAFISMSRRLGIDPICDTVKEGPAGLIARLESAGFAPAKIDGMGKIETLQDLANLDTTDISVEAKLNLGNARALIYPSGRALLSYLYDTPFFNALDELIQHGNLSLRGKLSSHRINKVHMSTIVNFYQGALVTLTNDTRVQNNMSALLRQMLILWPTSGHRRYTRSGRIDIALSKVESMAATGLKSLQDLSYGILEMPELPESVNESMIDIGVGIRYTVLNRPYRVSKLALAVAFWRIADGGEFEITRGDLAMADAILHMHEMGGRLFELVMSKGRIGHEFMRIFVDLLNGEIVNPGGEIAQASELNIGATAVSRLSELSVITSEGKLANDYRFVTGQVIESHKKRWRV